VFAKKYNVILESICDLNPELKLEISKLGAKLKFVNPNPTHSEEDKNYSS
jgi:hypothetical protein